MSITVQHSPLVLHKVHLRIGALDHVSVSQLRQVLAGCPIGPDVHLLVDLSQAGMDHDMTLFALLAKKARPLRATGGATTALSTNSRLGHLLTSIGVTVRTRPIPQARTGAQHVSVGELITAPDLRRDSQEAWCSSCA